MLRGVRGFEGEVKATQMGRPEITGSIRSRIMDKEKYVLFWPIDRIASFGSSDSSRSGSSGTSISSTHGDLSSEWIERAWDGKAGGGPIQNGETSAAIVSSRMISE